MNGVEPLAPPYIIALDIGTSSVRAAMFDRNGRPVAASAKRDVEVVSRINGASEVDPEGLLESIYSCIDETLKIASGWLDEIAGVAVCTFVSNMLGVDSRAQAITGLMTYADMRPAPDVLELRSRLDEESAHQRTGAHFHPSYWPARFAWLKRTQPELLIRARHWMSIGDYLFLNVFGHTACSYSVASWTGLLDRSRLEWDEELLGVLPVNRNQLSSLTDVDQPFQGLRAEFAVRWPSLARIPWFPAVGDGAAANLGSDCGTPSRVTVSMGTSSAVRVVLPDPVLIVPQGLWCYRVDRRRSLLGGALTEGGNMYAWLKRTLNLSEYPDLEKALPLLPPDGHGLTFLPLLAGERSPGWAGDARAAVTGISLATTPLDLLQAGMESVLLRIAQIYELLLPSLPESPEVVASGGAFLNSPWWRQSLADVLGCPVTTSLASEVSARGAALLALEGLHLLPDAAAAPRLAGAYTQDDPHRHEIYRAAVRRQKELYHQVIARRGKLK
jgi:gluconokinase